MILRLATSTVKNSILNHLFIKTGLDYTSPVHIYAQVNYQCNSKCKMCYEWRKDPIELPASIWIKAFKELKSLSNNIKLSIAGGESFLKRDLFEIFEFCNKNNIIYGITSNGIPLNKKNIEKLLLLNPFNINVSLDTLDKNIYQKIRGVQFLEKVKTNIEYLKEYKDKTGSKTVINIKTVVCNDNLNCLDKIAEYSQKLNIAGVTYQPIIETTEECRGMMDIDRKNLNNMVEKLIRKKKNGYNIMNSETNMRNWENHFDPKIIFQKKKCNVPLRNLYILANGDVQLCDYIDKKIGNIENESIIEILKKEETKKLKRELVDCKKNCTYCTQRTLKDYIYLTTQFLKN